MSTNNKSMQQSLNNNTIPDCQPSKYTNQETQCHILDKNVDSNQSNDTQKKLKKSPNEYKNSKKESEKSNNDEDSKNLNENYINVDNNSNNNIESNEEYSNNDGDDDNGNYSDKIIEEEEEFDSQAEESAHEYDSNEIDDDDDDDNDDSNSQNDEYYSDYYSDSYDDSSNNEIDNGIKSLPNSSSNLKHLHYKRHGNKAIKRSNSNSGKHKHHTKKRRVCTSDQHLNPKTEEGRKVIAHQTLKIIKTGKYTFRRKDNNIEEINIMNQISQCVEHTKTYRPNYYYKKKPRNPTVRKRKRMCQVEVVPESTYGVAKRLVKKEKFTKTCVLNFASATKPGGGFKNGRTAQEESLSRQSALYQSLKTHPEMYKYNLKHSVDDNFYNDYMIYSPKVPVFRSDLSERLFGKNEIFVTSVITSAAPNLKDVSKYEQNRKHYKKIFYERCRKILLLAIEKRNDVIVLGAYGCGVFENDPKFVSSVFKKLLFKGENGDEPLCNYFSKVVFAIIGCKSENFQIFSKRFKDYINPKRK